MNECEQIHPLLRGYLGETLSARDRRLVARHLNLCASARKELDRLRSGPVKVLQNPIEPPSEPWDLKILRWMSKTPKPASKVTADGTSKKSSTKIPSGPVGPNPSPLKPILLIVLFFGALILVTHFVQNASDNPAVKGVKRWLSRNGYHVLGVTSSLELVLDLSNLSHWNGIAAPVATSFNEIITDENHFKIYWQILQPKTPEPMVDFTKNALAVVFLGPKTHPGTSAKFSRMENFTDKTVLWYDEAPPVGGEMAVDPNYRPWVLQLVPKPIQQPVLIQKVQ